MSAIFGETLTFPQPAGPQVRLRVFGDEFYARYETLDGHTVVLDTDLGLYCYATLAGGPPHLHGGGDRQARPARAAHPPPGGPRGAQRPLRAPLRRAAAPPDDHGLPPGADRRRERRPARGAPRQRGHRPRPHDPRELRRPAGDREPRRRRGPAERGGLLAQRQPGLGARLLPHDVQRPARLPQHRRGAGAAEQAAGALQDHPPPEGGARPRDIDPRRRPVRLRLPRRGPR